MAKLKKPVVGSARAVAGVLLVAILVSFALIAWALPRGFDWTDEAWSYSLIASDRVTVGEPWGFQHLLHPLFALVGNSVLIFRVLRFFGYILIAIGLAWAVEVLAKTSGRRFSRTQKWILYISAQFGTVIAFSYPPRYISYNELAAWLAQIFVILITLLFAWSVESRSPRKTQSLSNLAWGAIGLVLAGLFGAKVTAFVVVAILAGVFWISHAQSLRQKLQWAGSCLLGILVGFGLMLAMGFPLLEYFQNLRYVFLEPNAQAEFAHPVQEILATYFGSGLDVLIRTLPIVLSATAIIVIGLLRPYSGRYRNQVIACVSVASIVVTVITCSFWPRDTNWNYLGASIGAVLLLLVLLFSVVTFSMKQAIGTPEEDTNKRIRANLWFGVVAVAAPVGAAVGTNNPIAGQMIFSATTWIVFAVGLLIAVSNKYERATFRYSLLGVQGIFMVLAGTILVAFSADMIQAQYRTAPYATQNTRTHARFVSGLSLTEEQASWSEWVSDSASMFNGLGVPTVALNTPGMLLLFNNNDFASPWISPLGPISARSIGISCSELSKSPSDFFVLQDGEQGMTSDWDRIVEAEIGKCGLRFPDDFTIVAERPSALVAGGISSIWRLNSAVR